ncbi:hypothetical protein PZH32_00915 [Adlercreutzia equolifaciens]|uniref:hypothetical protein n=1 Tax=Adlercreutzia equolifaciens TaxID=446660 RepID=UPI0023AF813B|nr:hypothetical protein [Adlercreutzia equolifaciens]MDE8701521.1 hypothetical protein [Adlercreutzia equolifaciens]
MSLEIPDSREDARIDREHEHEMLKHLKDHVGDEMRAAKDREERAKDKATHELKDKIGYEEKGERRQEDMTDAALKETANTILREE